MLIYGCLLFFFFKKKKMFIHSIGTLDRK